MEDKCDVAPHTPLCVLDRVLNMFPLLVALSLDPDRNNFEDGYFSVLAVELAGQWLADMPVVSLSDACVAAMRVIGLEQMVPHPHL